MPRAIHLTWQPSAGATRYLVQCSPTSPEGKEEGREVRGREGGEAGEPVWACGRGAQAGASVSLPQVRVGQPEALLDGLAPGRDYEVWVRSLRGAETSEAQSIRARTRECPARRLLPTLAPRNLPRVGDPDPIR